MKIKSDFELCMEVQAGNEKSEIMLWKRYQPQIKLHAIRLFRHFNELLTGLSIEDFCSEAWFKFHERVMVVHSDPADWIPGTQKTWRFTSLFWYDLMKLRNEWQKKMYADGTVIPLEFDTERDEVGRDENTKFHGEEFLSRYPVIEKNTDYDDLEEKGEQIKRMFSPLQREIVEMKREGWSFQDIADILGRSYGNVLKHFHKARKIAKYILAIA